MAEADRKRGVHPFRAGFWRRSLISRGQVLVLLLVVVVWSGAGAALRHHFADEDTLAAQSSLLQGQFMFQPELLRWSLRMDTIASIRPSEWPQAVDIHGIAARLIRETDGWIEAVPFPDPPNRMPTRADQNPEPERQVLAGQPRDLRWSSLNSQDVLADCRLSLDERRTVAGRVRRGTDTRLYLSMVRYRDLGAGQHDCLVLTAPKDALRFARRGNNGPVTHDVVLIDSAGQPLARILAGQHGPLTDDATAEHPALGSEDIGLRQTLVGLPDWSIVTLQAPGTPLQHFLLSPFALILVILLVLVPLAMLPQEKPALAPIQPSPDTASDLYARRMTRHERRGLALNALAQVRALLRAPDTPAAMHAGLAGIGTALDTLLTLEDRPADSVLAPSVFHPGDLAQEILTMLHPAADAAKIMLRSEIDWPAGPVRGPREAVVQILVNLLQNALKYAPGAQVTARVSAETDNSSGNRLLVLEVADTGPGVAVAQEKWLFLPGFRASALPQGEGFGLTIVARLARAAGGSVVLRNVPGEGMTVTVRLPVIAAEGVVEDLPRLDGLSILVVEDSAALREWIVQQLLRLGAEVEGVARVTEARMVADRLQPDAAVIDLSLGDSSGLDLARGLRHDRPGMHLIAFSADMDAARQAACLAAGFDAVQRKESDLTALIAVLAGLKG